MYHWTADGIGWMADASRQTDFYRLLAAELAPYLKPEDRICDAGCGLGFLSLALSPYVRSVTAAEPRPTARFMAASPAVGRGEKRLGRWACSVSSGTQISMAV